MNKKFIKKGLACDIKAACCNWGYLYKPGWTKLTLSEWKIAVIDLMNIVIDSELFDSLFKNDLDVNYKSKIMNVDEFNSFQQKIWKILTLYYKVKNIEGDFK